MGIIYLKTGFFENRTWFIDLRQPLNFSLMAHDDDDMLKILCYNGDSNECMIVGMMRDLDEFESFLIKLELLKSSHSAPMIMGFYEIEHFDKDMFIAYGMRDHRNERKTHEGTILSW